MVSSLLDAVCEKSYAEFPNSLIQSEVEYQVQNVEKQAKQYNLPVEALLQYSGVQSMDDFKKRVEENSRKSFLRELVIDEIAKVEEIKPTDEEIENKYAEIAGVKPEDDEKAKKAKVEKVKKQYQVSQIAYSIKANKVIEFLKANAITKETKETK